MSMWLTLLLSLGAQAQISSPPPAHRPPKEAVQACDQKKDGDTCTFVSHKSENVEGKCLTSPAKHKPLACKPDNTEKMSHE